MRWVVIAVVTILVACGGSGDALTTDEYQSEVHDAIGQAKLDELIALMEDVSAQPALSLNEQWKSDVLDALETWHEPLAVVRNIDPPDGAEDAQDAALQATECLSDVADRIGTLVESEAMGSGGNIRELMDSCASLGQDMNTELDALD